MAAITTPAAKPDWSRGLRMHDDNGPEQPNNSDDLPDDNDPEQPDSLDGLPEEELLDRLRRLSDEHLMDFVRDRSSGDPVHRCAFNVLVDRYQNELIGTFVKKRGLQQADADDLTQQTWVRVFVKRHQWRTQHFRGWLHKIAWNIVIDWIKKRGRDRVPQTPPDGDERDTQIVIPQPGREGYKLIEVAEVLIIKLIETSIELGKRSKREGPLQEKIGLYQEVITRLFFPALYEPGWEELRRELESLLAAEAGSHVPSPELAEAMLWSGWSTLEEVSKRTGFSLTRACQIRREYLEDL